LIEDGEKDFLNSKELYAPFKDIDIATLEDNNTVQTIKKAVQLPSATKRLYLPSIDTLLKISHQTRST